jgi:hypothetical protein
MGAEPRFQAAAQGRAARRQERRGVVQRAGEPAPEPRRQRPVRAEGGAALAQEMAEGLRVDGAERRLIGQHDVEPVRGQPPDHFLQLALVAGDVDLLRQRKRGPEDFVGEELGEGVHHAEVQAEGLRAGPLPHGRHQFAAQGKNLLRVAEYQLAGVGQPLRAALAAEQPLPEGRLQLAELRRDGRGGHAQVPGRRRQAARLGDGVKVAEMVIVEPVHARCQLRLTKATVQKNIFVRSVQASDYQPTQPRP